MALLEAMLTWSSVLEGDPKFYRRLECLGDAGWALLSSELLGFVEVVVWFCLGIWCIRDEQNNGHGILNET